MSKELKYNIIFCILLAFIGQSWEFSTDMIFNNGGSRPFDMVFIALFITFNIAYFSVYAINYLVVAPRFLTLKTIGQYVLWFIVMVLCFACIRFLLEEVLLHYLIDIHNYNLNRPDIIAIYMFDSTLYAFKPVLFSSLMFLFFRNRDHQERLHQIELQQQEAKMAMLRSQISPHFLFNTLNGLYSDLYEERPKTASDILRLSDLLRYITYDTDKNFMPLSKEFMFIKDYLYFYEKRYEANYYVKLNVEGAIENQKIPPLILIHFIENLFKHGIIDDPKQPALITIKVDAHALSIETRNTINTAENYTNTGIGTENIKARLQLLFKDQYHLHTSSENNQYRAYLKFPIYE